MKRILFSLIAMVASATAFAQNEMEALAQAAEEQIGMYNTYDASERPVDKFGLISTDGCCIDVLLRAWDKAIAHHDESQELSSLYRNWYAEMDKTDEWKKRGGRTLAHRRCRNVIQLFRNHLVPWTKTDTPERGCIIFFIYEGSVWHVAVSTGGNEIVHNIGGGVMRADIREFGNYVCYKHD